MSEPYNYMGLICQVSGNPCGTDTHAVGFPCQCGQCRACARIAELESAEARRSLTFEEFRKANVARCLKWHPEGIESWSDSDWLVAVMGELGELASLIKMQNRERDGLSGNKFSPTREQIAKEGADVVTYLDLFLARNGIDMGLWAALKFNEVSERVGFPDRIHINGQKDHGNE